MLPSIARRTQRVNYSVFRTSEILFTWRTAFFKAKLYGPSGHGSGDSQQADWVILSNLAC